MECNGALGIELWRHSLHVVHADDGSHTSSSRMSFRDFPLASFHWSGPEQRRANRAPAEEEGDVNNSLGQVGMWLRRPHRCASSAAFSPEPRRQVRW